MNNKDFMDFCTDISRLINKRLAEFSTLRNYSVNTRTIYTLLKLLHYVPNTKLKIIELACILGATYDDVNLLLYKYGYGFLDAKITDDAILIFTLTNKYDYTIVENLSQRYTHEIK